MTGQDRNTNSADFLDFPGAGRLRAAGKVAPPSADAVATALAAVRSAASQAREDGPAVELEREPVAAIVPVRTWRRHLPVLVSAAAVVAIALGIAFQPWSGSENVQGSPAAEERAGTAPYWKVRTLQWNRSIDKTKRPDETYETVWVSRSGTRGKPGNHPVQDYSQKDMGGTAYVIGDHPVMWDDLKKLPTEPVALRARLVGKTTGESAAEGLFDGVEELLTRSPAEPRLRAALFKVLTGIPGARVTERVKDSTGRAGTAVELDADTWRRQLIVDTRAFHVLESRDTARNDGLPWGNWQLRAGDLLHRTTYLSMGPVWTAPELDPLTE
ncbi:hypothetical protein [Streptomyces zagrosensis]|uniref:CU044_5270 family protein n=1 Tax=Streptomyces zagrosensis TaxID=1042984 RepID=A0A7W9UY07_9ACTN|nr:hypothetical protein [Streptomyces zagrosensis]MBB5935448.1 hypothetical protein [Streptomyces zagrosensis]